LTPGALQLEAGWYNRSGIAVDCDGTDDGKDARPNCAPFVGGVAMDRILIIDDNPNDVEITQIALAEKGWQLNVETAKRGDLALEWLRSSGELPFLIILDLKIPGMSGIECLKAIRADEKLQEIPVAIVTSSSDPADKKSACDAGADDFLYKAFDIDQYSEDLDNLINRFKKI
jgi:CheY-like chemotaxis protein